MIKANGATRRRILLSGVAFAALASVSLSVSAQDLGGELVIMQWQGGTDLDMWHEVEARFLELNPGVTIREFQPAGGQGDARGGMRTALLGGEVVDIIINTWPAFRVELANAGILRPIDEQWAEHGWDEKLSASWKDLGAIDGVPYGVTYTYGDRSAIWYKTAHLEKAGIEPPATWDEFLASFDKLRAAGFSYPVVVPAKYWAHGEWFETLLLRTSGVEAASQLASHEIAWTDPKVKAALLKFKEMLDAGCCADAATMLATDPPYDPVFSADEANYMLYGMWTNARLKRDFELEEGVDYSIFQFPALGMGFDDTSSVDSKELVVTTNGNNPDAADAFLDFIISADAANIMGNYGYASPSAAFDSSMLGPVQKVAVAAVASSDVHFVLGDLLPGDLVDEYRVQLQRFLQDPSEEMIDTVLAAIEAKAATAY